MAFIHVGLKDYYRCIDPECHRCYLKDFVNNATALGLSPGVAASKQPDRCASPGPGETRLVVVVSYITFCYLSILSATFLYVSTFVIGDLGGGRPKFSSSQVELWWSGEG